MAKTKTEVTTYQSKEVKVVKESTTLGKIVKGALITGGIILALGAISSASTKK